MDQRKKFPDVIFFTYANNNWAKLAQTEKFYHFRHFRHFFRDCDKKPNEINAMNIIYYTLFNIKMKHIWMLI